MGFCCGCRVAPKSHSLVESDVMGNLHACTVSMLGVTCQCIPILMQCLV